MTYSHICYVSSFYFQFKIIQRSCEIKFIGKTTPKKCRFCLTLFLIHILLFPVSVSIQDYIKQMKREFDPSLNIPHIGTSDLSLEDTSEAIFTQITAIAESLKKEHNEVAISNIAARGDDLKQ